MLPTYADMLPTYPYVTCRLDIVSTFADTVFGHVANMLADMSATCWANTHVSVDSTIFLTFENPTFPAKPTVEVSVPMALGFTLGTRPRDSLCSWPPPPPGEHSGLYWWEKNIKFIFWMEYHTVIAHGTMAGNISC